jgi:hypothetical protein
MPVIIRSERTGALLPTGGIVSRRRMSELYEATMSRPWLSQVIGTHCPSVWVFGR